MRYLIVEQTKKQKALKIGIFTVFLVVMAITMLKSAVDCTPIIFVKIGQDQVGAIDYSMSSPSGGNGEINANMNWYNIDPFHNPFNYTMQPYAQASPSSFDKGLRRAKMIDPNKPKDEQNLLEAESTSVETFKDEAEDKRSRNSIILGNALNKDLSDDPPPEPTWL